MYSVMLVDDDYPVIELLAETVNWGELDMRLIGTHENGLSAWEHARREMPDILITDIGMPKMDGLQLISLMKEQKANLRIVILSCHDEFQYARQAMRMNVQDYLLKDAFNPEDLLRLLGQFKLSLDEEQQTMRQQSQLRRMVDGAKELHKEQWLRSFIHQPLLAPAEWMKEANAMGLFRQGEACLPVVGSIGNYRLMKQKFMSEQTIRFVVSNVLAEIMPDLRLPGIHIAYGVKTTFLLFSFRQSLKLNIYDEAAACLKEIQSALRKTLGLRMSFITDRACASREELKLVLNRLLDSDVQRFYLEEGEIARKRDSVKPQDDLFSWYDQANAEFRELLLGKRADCPAAFIERWATMLGERQYAPEQVKNWVLKLLIDQKLKLQSIQFLGPRDLTDTLHTEIGELDSLAQLKQWWAEQTQALVSLTGVGSGAGMRPEVVEACQYAELNLHKRISLEEIAEHLYLNPSYFSRLFKKETGKNFIEYVTRLKMEKAKEMLDRTGHSVGQICELLGYDNQSYFIKIFKAYTGSTPSEYRKGNVDG